MAADIGTYLKINVHIDELDGIKMSDMDFACDFFVHAGRSQTIPKEDMLKADDENYVALVDSAQIGKGIVRCKVTAYVPDGDFVDGVRKEVCTVSTDIIIQ